jgi:hypothetical protein
MDAIHETVHRILTDTSLQQFDDKLHSLNERRPLDRDGNPIQSDSSETKESEKEEVCLNENTYLFNCHVKFYNKHSYFSYVKDCEK